MLNERETEHIKREVFFKNELNRFRNEETPKLLNALKGFIGDKIRRKDKTLNKKILKALDGIINFIPQPLHTNDKTTDNAKLRFWFSGDFYNLMVGVDICFSGGDYEKKTQYCIYKEDTIYLGSIENDLMNAKHTLTELNEFKPHPYIKISEELNAVEKALKQKAKMEQAELRIKILQNKEFVRKFYIPPKE